MKNYSLGRSASTAGKILLWVGSVVIATIVTILALFFVALGHYEDEENSYH